jgi:hypothetical protein
MVTIKKKVLLQFHAKKVYLLLLLGILLQTSAFAQNSSFSELKPSQDKELSKKASYYKDLGYDLLSRLPEGGIVPAGKYVAINDLAISRGQTVTIQAGTLIYFEAGKQIFIDGKLLSNGTSTSKILLTNIPFDQSYIPVFASDSLWGGIEVGISGVINLSYTQIQNAKQGINASGSSDLLKLDCVDIRGIDQNRFTFNQTQKIIADTTCFSFPPPSLIDKTILTKEPNWKITKIWGLSTGVLIVGTIASGIITKIYYDKSMESNIPYQVNKDGDMARNVFYSVQVCGGASIAATISTTISFSINKKRARAKQ